MSFYVLILIPQRYKISVTNIHCARFTDCLYKRVIVFHLSLFNVVKIKWICSTGTNWFMFNNSINYQDQLVSVRVNVSIFAANKYQYHENK